jgi:hypothetical protein
MTTFFDNIFVRVHEFYNKKNYIPVAMGIYFLIVTQVCIVFTLAISFNLATGGMFASEKMDKATFYTIYGVIIIGLAFLDIRRYASSKTRKTLELRFKRRKSIPIWLIFMIPILFLSIGLALIFTLTTGK